MTTQPGPFFSSVQPGTAPAAPAATVGCQELAKALAQAQGELRSAEKDATNPHFSSRYATLSAVWDACREPLARHGLSVVQLPQVVNSQLMLETRLMHTSGEWIHSWWPIQPVKNDPQGLGSALTYARRYTLAAMVGVAPDDDDDGDAASVPPKSKRPRLSKTQPADAALPDHHARKAGDAVPPESPASLPDVLMEILNAGSLKELNGQVWRYICESHMSKHPEVVTAFVKRRRSFFAQAKDRQGVAGMMERRQERDAMPDEDPGYDAATGEMHEARLEPGIDG